MSTETEVRITKTTDVRRQGGAVNEAMRETAKKAAGLGFQTSQRHVPKDTSELMLSGIPPTEESDGSWFWAYDAPHTLPVEYGSRPHWAPLQALLDWGRRVLGSEEAGKRVWYHIAHHGTQPHPFVRPGMRRQRAHLRHASGLKTTLSRKLKGGGFGGRRGER